MAEPQTACDPRSIAAIRLRKAKIIVLCTLAAIAYGIVHDQITARLCIEYFTIGHPPVFHTTSPTVLAICWGIAATCGAGTLLGYVLAQVSQSEGFPPLPMRSVYKSILSLLAVMAISASLAGIVGFELSRREIIGLPGAFVELLPTNRQHRFMAVWFVHGASYLVGITGALSIILRIWLARGRPRVLTVLPHTIGGVIRALVLAAIAVLAVWLRFART
jgi:hypothetical protein